MTSVDLDGTGPGPCGGLRALMGLVRVKTVDVDEGLLDY